MRKLSSIQGENVQNSKSLYTQKLSISKELEVAKAKVNKLKNELELLELKFQNRLEEEKQEWI